MSEATALAWGLTSVPDPLQLPFVAQSALMRPLPDRSGSELDFCTPSTGLDILDSTSNANSVVSKKILEMPSFGMSSDPMSPLSVSRIQMKRLKDEMMKSALSTSTGPTNWQTSGGGIAAVESGLQSSHDGLSSSSSLVNASQRTQEARLNEIRAKHYSQNSRLSSAQHRQWWSTKGTGATSSVNDPLKIAIAGEQRLYKESMKQLVLETCAANFLAFPPLVEACIEALFAELKSNATIYPPYYTFSGASKRSFHDMRHITLNNGFSQRLPLVSVIQRRDTKLAVGTTFELPHIPTPFHSITLPRSGDFWIGRNQTRSSASESSSSATATALSVDSSTAQHNSSSKLPTFLKQVQIPVSIDQNVRSLMATNHELSFAMSASTLCKIANTSIEVPWEVPIRVEELLDENGRLHKVILLDKPLLARDMSIKQKNQKFYKMSLKRWLLQNQQTMKMDDASSSTASTSNARLSDSVPHQSIGTKLDLPCVTQGPDNLVYTEWKVGDLKILVRTRVDALTCTSRAPPMDIPATSTPAHAHSASPSANQPKQGVSHIPTSIVAKMKHVPDHHLEELSLYERTQFLLKSQLIGDDARILIGHVDPVSARLLSVESLSHHQLKAANAPSIEACWTQLHDILTWCRTLTAGHFLLSHAPNETHLTLVELFANKNDVLFKGGLSATYDLHERQRSAALSNLDMVEYLAPRWDFLRVGQIPNTFPPVGRSCCFNYLRNGKCNQTSCSHLHITKYEADVRGISTAPPNHGGNSESGNTDANSDKRKKRRAPQQNPSPSSATSPKRMRRR